MKLKFRFFNYKKLYGTNKLFLFYADEGCDCGCGMREFSHEIRHKYYDKYVISFILFNFGVTLFLLEEFNKASFSEYQKAIRLWK